MATGSVVRVTTDKTEDIPNYNILQSLQGRVPGLVVTSPNRPGQNPAISIRGVNSISAGTSPLVVVDGIIYNGSLSDFNAMILHLSIFLRMQVLHQCMDHGQRTEFCSSQQRQAKL